ncbi:hypothetical protein LTR70_001135 [Exophiala xenobiotica]|uniref:BZIP transcription factor n=1 Tax=Lithohypha guttulata TaxID=1690604 RepID=A0ABR0KMM7_9EURO|nr:hypothetical protein LTR24_000676 [Lithohypha guttulata]KAK5328981.1 hypothetical protein LTR70_001135 [Exophiala xenobiotica]
MASNDGKPAKRRRKDAGDSRAERKRELDRIAQRATRERTKNRIADLEQRLASLESGDKNNEIALLTKTIGELRNENARYQSALVKMRFAINEAVGETETAATRRGSSSTTVSQIPDLDLSRSNSMVDVIPDDTSIVSPIQSEGLVLASGRFSAPTQAQRLQSLYDAQGYSPPTPHEYGSLDINQIYEFFEYGSGNPFSHPSPLTGRMPPAGGFISIAPDEHKWKTSDDALGTALQSSTSMIADFDEGLLVRAILLGWESIGPAANHPILCALQCIDQRVFGKWTSRPQRLALMYICGCAMRYKANPTEENKLQVPAWFLPRPAQERIQHPLVIDFLVWPGLRERLVFEYEKYTATGDFSFCFVEYFHFYWPYPNEQVAQYDQSGLICGLSKLYHDFVYDLKHWTMLPPFFDRFPEMRADIDMFVEPATIGYQGDPGLDIATSRHLSIPGHYG